MKIKRFELELTTEGYTYSDVADELERVAERLREGRKRGFVNGGEWELKSSNICTVCGGSNGDHQDIRFVDVVDYGEPHLKADVGARVCPKISNNN